MLRKNISSTRFLSPDPGYWREQSNFLSAWHHYSFNNDQLLLSTSVHAGCALRQTDWVTTQSQTQTKDLIPVSLFNLSFLGFVVLALILICHMSILLKMLKL